MVALNVLYNTGARDERPTQTGIAHLYEHMMFGGSADVPDFDTVLTAAGGESNAWTSNDFTDFYQVAPAVNAETLFYLESDRMLSPALTQASLDVQRQVVIEEFKQQCLNRPYGDMSHVLRGLLYGDHPYSWPVIGKEYSHIESVTAGDLRQWFTDHYAPAGAVLAVTGHISWQDTLRLAEKWFGTIPARPVAKRHIAPIASPAEPIVHTMNGNVPATMVTVAYLMDSWGTRRYHAADAITDILSAGKASRFFQHFVVGDDKTFTEADASITGAEHQGMLMLSGRLASEDTDPREAVQKLIRQAQTIVTRGVTQHELERVKNRQRTQQIMENLSYLERSQYIAMAVMHGQRPGQSLDDYMTLTVGDIQAEADRLFNHTNPVILIYRPNKQSQQ